MNSTAKILIYIAGGIGNTVLAIPSFKALKSMGYEVFLAIPGDWARSKPLFDLLGNQPFVDGFFSLSEDLSFDVFEKIYIPVTQEKSLLRTVLENADNSLIISHPKWRDSLIHESAFFMAMARNSGFIGPMPSNNIVLPSLTLPFSAPYIAIAFSCLEGYPWSLKRWPREHWINLCLNLLEQLPDIDLVFVGSLSDKSEAELIMSEIGSPRVHSVCGSYRVDESAFILSNSKCLISIDNGISHLASAANVPAIFLIYGPTLLSKNIPLGENIFILRHQLTCSPCFETKKFRECTYNACMHAIDPHYVASRVVQWITDL